MNALEAPRVSVIVPAYNAAPYVRETLLSLVNQTYQNLEVVVVDDGSTDETGDVVKEFLPRISFMQVPNRGVCAARNIGVSSCSGELIIFIDADDVVGPDHIERMARPLVEDSSVGVSFCDTLWFKESAGERTELGRSKKGYFEQDPQRWLMRSFISMGAAMYRKELFQMVGGFDVSLHNAADVDLHLKMVRRSKWKHVPETWLQYRVLPVSMSKNYPRFYFQSRNVRLKHMLNFEGSHYWRFEIKQMTRAMRKRAAAEIRASLARTWSTPAFLSELKRATGFLAQNPSVVPYVLLKRLGPRQYHAPQHYEED